ncbi:hypothetical protein B0F90DRAFT_894483 [Multifurca ochricompacta]|uniref:Uncharacterized protein n=1 Tax=Multifurca ochricompacta TaxID=376703 RepID=A0AAD4M216_9AGAM|nr:hypothetical protein B0F90DRAFT_894483 [Multifurca ochricompacta]
MSTTVITPSQRLRIAIGLAALKYKPPEQSTESYVLDLKHHFCRSATRFISEEYDAWRKRALELEAELHATRATASSEHLELLALKSAFATLEEEKGLGRKASESKKRKRVKKPSQTSYTYAKRLELSSPLWSSRLKLTKPKDKGFAYSGNTESITSPRRPNSTLFSSLHALDVISAGINTTNSTSPPDIALLAAATVNALTNLAHFSIMPSHQHQMDSEVQRHEKHSAELDAFYHTFCRW